MIPVPEMSPAPESRLVRHVGDRLEVRLELPQAGDGWQARVRTTIGCGDRVLARLAAPITGERPVPGGELRDVPMEPCAGGFRWHCTLTEPGFHPVKAYAVDPDGRSHWPIGDDAGICVHPAWTRSGNTLYCAFARMFGPNRTRRSTVDPLRDEQFALLDRHGYTLIPPSGTLRDLTARLDHIFDRLGCRILHLLPITPTPTTKAKYGRFGSPYAAQDFTAIDPALVEHDRRTTGIEQFEELTDAVHKRDGHLFLDLAINHTGWGSTLYEQHPEWFVRNDDGSFHSPGAWGVTWEDLVELDHRHVDLWRTLAEAFLVWCDRGVDGFRCDAGYMVPVAVWQAVIARVQQDFPDTVFLLEGLGGAWEATADLLTLGRMQWAYSELFQNFGAAEIARYNDHCLRQHERVGLLFHYSETHDNDRLAARGRAWSLFRNRLSALLSHQGGFGFTCGVEWLADEKLQVHQSRGLNWGSQEHLLPQLADLNRLLTNHPAFRDGARCNRISAPDDPVYALSRCDADGANQVLVLANTDPRHEHRVRLPEVIDSQLGEDPIDLLEPLAPPLELGESGDRYAVLAPLRCSCLADGESAARTGGEAYRAARGRHAAACQVLAHHLGPEHVGPIDWRELADRFHADPTAVLAAAVSADPALAAEDLPSALDAVDPAAYRPVVVWRSANADRVTPIPPDHWLLVLDDAPFRLRLRGAIACSGRSVPVAEGHAACIRPSHAPGEAQLTLVPTVHERGAVSARLRFLAAEGVDRCADGLGTTVLLTNHRGGMARIPTDFLGIRSKYDCLLAANLHPAWPVDRHVLAKRLRMWLHSDHFHAPIDGEAITRLEPGPPARWHCEVPAGNGRLVPLTIVADMPRDRNETVIRVRRLGGEGIEPVRLVLRVDIEDRSFHGETLHGPQAEAHFARHVEHREDGFRFESAADRHLEVSLPGGSYRTDAEWCHAIPHPVEAERGQHGHGDAWSPGWFAIDLAVGSEAVLTVSAEDDPAGAEGEPPSTHGDPDGTGGSFEARLQHAIDAFVVRREHGATVIAGYPWFLDWGRDTLICARGLLAAGRDDDVRDILAVFGAFEQAGTLPNCIHGGDASNRDTSDAALWYAVVAEEAAERCGEELYDLPCGTGRTIREVLRSIAEGHLAGTPTGIKVDPASGLVWSPAHFTWMDTNHPAATPRTGYPVEIQVLWWRLLRLLDRIAAEPPTGPSWSERAEGVASAVEEYFWLEDRGWWADCLIAPDGQAAAKAVVDDALRSNALLVVALGLGAGERARRSVDAALRHLVVPGALRSLAPLRVSHPLHVRDAAGRALVDPHHPYQGRYLGDEDTSRKPAYHNGTAWTWPFPVFCEALARAYPDDPRALAAGRSYLGSMDRLLAEGCPGQLPEIVDGDAPHDQRGCDAQAWGATEALRVHRALG